MLLPFRSSQSEGHRNLCILIGQRSLLWDRKNVVLLRGYDACLTTSFM